MAAQRSRGKEIARVVDFLLHPRRRLRCPAR
jgi:hypothetical protein